MSIKSIVRKSLAQLTAIDFVRNLLRQISRIDSIALPDSFWQRFPVNAEFTVENPTGASFLYSSHGLEPIGRSLFWKGILGYEPETIELFIKLVKSAKNFIDIGSNTGLFSLLAVSNNQKVQVYAFEPVPFTRNLLEHNIKINGFQDQISVSSYACSDKSGIDRFYIPDGAGTPDVQARLASDGDNLNGEYIEVTTTKFDDFLDNNRSAFADDSQTCLVKIDVEGFEDKVLTGMSETIDRLSPIIIFECNPGGQATAIGNLLQGKNYTLFSIQRNGVDRVEQIVPDLDLKFRNFLAIPAAQLHNPEIVNIIA
jgi:FkbM family methyltransferase